MTPTPLPDSLSWGRDHEPRRGDAMRAILGCAVLALACAGTAAQEKKDDKKDESGNAKKLIGKWETGDKKAPVLIEFAAEGKMTLMAGEPGKEIKAEGTYKLDGDKLDVSLKFMG